jgi:adenylylsulfate kinase
VSGVVVWFTGKPSAGKSTLAVSVRDRLAAEGTRACLLDGDVVRGALVPRPGYDPKARDEFYATLANLAALLATQGLVVLVAATAHLRTFRERAKQKAPAFVEVHVDASREEVETRDARGLYAAVKSGRVGGVPGADLVYEPPVSPDVTSHGGVDASAVEAVLRAVREKLESTTGG